MHQLTKIILHFITFALSFYGLSSLDMAKLLLPVENRSLKAQLLLLLMSFALGYLVAQFFINIAYQI